MVTVDKVIADIEKLPATEVGRVAAHCKKLMGADRGYTKGLREKRTEISPISKLLGALKSATLPEVAGDDARLERILGKHGQ